MSETPYPRDLVGYGRKRPDPKWPGGARLALNFVLNYEEGSEYSIPDGDGNSETQLLEATPSMPSGTRDLNSESIYEYGSRVGVWRLIGLLEEYKMPATVFGCALALERNPEVVAAIRAAGYDVCSHGWRWIKHWLLSPAEEAEHIKRAVASLQRSFGTRPVGWYCRTGPSVNTRRLIVEEGGFLYDSDSYADELPYWDTRHGQPHLVIPYSVDTNDTKFANPAGFANGDEFFSYLKDSFDCLYREGVRQPGMMSVGLHMRLAGRPGRAEAFRRFLDYVRRHEGVWICRRIDIANHWIANHPLPDEDDMTDDVRWARAPLRGYDLRLPATEDVELTHVEAGTPAGEYLRRFWTPVAMTAQLGDKPVPIRILGEDLVIFRDGGGNIGLLHRHCAHRRASLEFGRIEARGIRCCYHGWHFDVDGTILETPGEPATSSICKSICQPAYPVREIKGLVFAYMGPPDEMPSFPYLDSLDLSDHELIPYSIHSPCNWLQETENAIDPFHSVFLHGRVNGPQFPGLEHFVELPVVSYHRRDAGIVYSHARRVGDLVMLRFHDYLMPNLAQNGGMFQRLEKPTFFGRTSLTKWVVPIDSTNSRKFGWRHFNDKDEVLRQGKRDEVGWETVDFYGQTAHRPYAERQSNPGDWDVWVSQGPVAIHSREYLGRTDEGIAMLRRRLRREIRAVAKGEKIPHIVGDEKNPYPTYGGDTVLRVVKSNDDEALMRTLQNEVAEIYFAADALKGEERTARIKADLKAKFPDSAS